MIEFVLGGFGGVLVTGAALFVGGVIDDAITAARQRRERLDDLETDVDYLRVRVQEHEDSLDHAAEDIVRLEDRVDDIDAYLTAVDSVDDEEVEEAE